MHILEQIALHRLLTKGSRRAPSLPNYIRNRLDLTVDQKKTLTIAITGTPRPPEPIQVRRLDVAGHTVIVETAARRKRKFSAAANRAFQSVETLTP